MLVKNIFRSCVLLVLSGLSSVAVSQTLTYMDALQLIDADGLAEVPDNYTSIGSGAFQSTTVKRVFLPDSIISIGAYAFSGASMLREINLPSGITVIEQGAFRSTSSLESITLPDSIHRIEASTFYSSGIKEINVPWDLDFIGSSAFAHSELESINLPVAARIKSSAFRYTKIKHLQIPDYTKLGQSSFSNLSELASLEIGEFVSMEDSNQRYIFDGSGNNLQTFITSSPIGCDNQGYGICPGISSNLSNLEFLVIKKNIPTDPPGYNRYISSSNTKVVIQAVENYNGLYIDSSEVILVSPTSISQPINDSPHSYCSGIDTDEDGFPDCYDQFPNDSSKWYEYAQTAQDPNLDSDNDGILDIFDMATSQNFCHEDLGFILDSDQDGRYDSSDCDDDNDGLFDIYEPLFGTNPLIPDSDFDGTLDGLDAFPMDNTESLDTDTDGIGNNADIDDDNDGYTDFLDAFPTDSTEWADSDSDGIGNNSDLDDDNDGVADTEDAFPHTVSESLDSDNDGVGDNADAFPNDATEVADTDLDGIGNNADPDDDNDGVADANDGDPLNADIGIQPSQLISVAGNPVGVNGHSTRISLSYDTSDGNNQLPGIGFRLHYSSEMLSFAGTENSIANDIIVDGDGPYQDDSDYDNDSNTDKYIIFGWAALNGDWPNSSLPASLVDVVFNVSWEAFDQASITTPINFSKVSTTEGYNFEATNYTLNVLPATWDFDGNGQADALTDGLILLRHAFGVRGASLTDSVMATDSTMTSDEVQVAVEKALVIADVDGDGNVDALTDGLIVLRYMFGLTGDTLMDGVVSANATRASAESVQQHIELYMPNNLLPPVQSEQNFIVGDWKLASIPEERDYELGVLGEWSTLSGYHGYTQSIFDTCVADDIYRFGDNGTFEYLISGSTYMHDEINPLWNYDNPNSYCTEPFAPWNESEIYTYNIDENNSLLTVIGRGAYIALAHVANGTNDIYMAALAPESISYNFNKTSESQIILELDAFGEFYRFTLEKVVN